MAKTKKSTNNILPYAILAALGVGGGYYWGSHSNTVDDVEINQVPTNTNPVDYYNDESSQVVDESDGGVEIDESGNVIYSDGSRTTNAVKHSDTSKKTSVIGHKKIGKSTHTTTTVSYRTHIQGRWGYSIKCPTFLSKSSQSQNSDGSTFTDGNGVVLSTYGSWNVFGESISDLYKKKFPETKSITYKRILKDQNSYVKSGYTTDDKIFYLKETITQQSDQEVVMTLFLTYPKNCKWKMEPIINEVFGNFPLLTRR